MIWEDVFEASIQDLKVRVDSEGRISGPGSESKGTILGDDPESIDASESDEIVTRPIGGCINEENYFT